MRLIDADAAIDAVVGCTNCGTEDVLREYVIKHSLENGWTGGIVDALDAIEQLPSIQPEHCGDAVSRNAIVQKLNKMDRYVSAELRLCDTDKKFPQNEVFIVDDVYEEIVEQLPSVQPERLTDDDFETIRVHLNAYKEKLCNQKRWEEAEEYQRIIDRFMTFASAQPERPTGEWIQKPRYEDDEYPDVQPNLKCPFCGYEISWWDMGNYCAKCGADLKGGAN